MSESMHTQFRIDLEDGLSGPIDKIIGMLERIDQALGRVGGDDPFDKMWEPIDRATRATNGLNETIERTEAVMASASGATRVFDESLTATGAAATEAGEALNTMGQNAQRAAEQAMSAMRAVQSTLNSGYGASGDGEASARFDTRSYLRNVGGSAHHFHEAIEQGMGRAFGAAAAGFGLIEPVHAAAEFDNTLTHIGIGLGYDGDANRDFAARYGMQINQLARLTGQHGTDLADAAGFFSREGYSGTKLDAVMPVVAHIATAYNAAPEAVAKSTFALQENLGVDDKSLGGALASIALAGKQADLPFEKLAPLLPQVASQAGMLGVRGRSGVDDLAALLAVARKSTGTEGEAVTNTRAFLQAITSPHTAKRFAEFGVDLFGTEAAARAKGIDPMIAVLQQVNRITHGGHDAKALGTLFNNQEDRGFVTAILQHMDQYFSIREKVAGADQSVIDRDFHTGMRSTQTELASFEEALSQILRLIGEGFVPTLHLLTIGLHGVISGLEWMQRTLPGVLPVILGVTSGMIALGAALMATSAILGPLRASFGLLRVLLIPLRLAFLGFAGVVGLPAAAMIAGAAILGVAAYEIYKHWDFVKKAFTGFGSWLDSWASWLLHLGSHGTPKAAGSTPDKFAMITPGQNPKLHLHISTDPGAKVETKQSHPDIRLAMIDTGHMMARA